MNTMNTMYRKPLRGIEDLPKLDQVMDFEKTMEEIMEQQELEKRLSDNEKTMEEIMAEKEEKEKSMEEIMEEDEVKDYYKEDMDYEPKRTFEIVYDEADEDDLKILEEEEEFEDDEDAVEEDKDYKYKQIDFALFDKNGVAYGVNHTILALYILEREDLLFNAGKMGGVFTRYLKKKKVWHELNQVELNRMILGHVHDINLKKNVNRLLSEVITALQTETKPTTFNHFNRMADNYYVNCKNGVFCAATGKFIRHDKRHYFTAKVNANYLQREVDLETEAPNFYHFLNYAFRDKELIDFTQEMLGYCLTWDVESKKFFVNYGETNAGKSTISRFIMSLLEDNLISALNWQDFSESKNVVDLYQKMINISGDLPGTPITNEDKIKALVGEDKISAWKLYVGNIEFTNRAKIICNTNTMPDNYGDKSAAFYNRLMIIPYRFSVPEEERDTQLDLKLMKEADVIFTWALQGYRRLVLNGHIFTKSKLMQEELERYKSKSSLVLQFVEEMCILDSECSIQKAWLYDEFLKYATKEVSKEFRLPRTKFYKELLDVYPQLVERKDSSLGGKWIFKGIKLA